ncbi:MAG: SpoIIIAH-like family protein [Clostridia bacterium]|nr:SpoIIIAH-like family protein [Clostridia bacterium]
MKQNSKLSKIGQSLKANRKKIIVVCTMVALLIGTGCLNYFLNVKTSGNNNDDVVQEQEQSFFETYRTDRESTRNQEIAYLDEIIASASSTETAILDAESQKLNITSSMETELVLEGLIKAKGFEDCIVTMSTENVNIVVMDEDLTLEEAAQILNIVETETTFTAPDVVIIPYV